MESILVIDDDKTVQGIIKSMLEGGGYRVSVIADGRRGMAALERGQFDLVIVDIFMPAMDGFETIQAIRQRRPDLPIIVISGFSVHQAAGAGPDFLAMAMKLGAWRSLRKPFRPDELMTAIESCLAERNRRVVASVAAE